MKHLIEQWIFFPLLGLLIVLIAVTSPIFASESNIYNPESLIVCTNAIDARESAKVMTLIGECTKVNGRPIEMISEVDHGYNHIGTWAVFEIRGVGEENVFYSPSYKSFNGR